ncbi:alpha-amylase [Aspergillus saccharolyticus JOP 1030-1]|uniref:alpha-amylase n=1 Tax=Aspergillus saccharolyticus JOP 1030-1 TaxID=1450539 RepID=A0A319AC36_9EURO|nr:glycoside hydrolase [Aspergillus saccharolyticus JOP 1030-1]PYH49228.1 glycoside hydrolase [Aspergillus saccharolyticus JOP 1030-1]
MTRLIYTGGLLTTVASLALAAPSIDDWTQRSIYQVLTDRFARPHNSPDAPCDPTRYCGGTWAGIIDQLDYIQDLGFTAISISPVVENIAETTSAGEAWHGHWPQDLYALNAHFGTAEELRALADELHRREMYLMVEVTLNNMAQAVAEEDASTIDYSRLHPFNEEGYYHPYCNMSDTTTTTSQTCWLADGPVALPDLRTEDARVSTTLQTWIQGLVSNYSVDGLRIAATDHMDPAFLSDFTRAAGVFTLGEVDSVDATTMCQYDEAVSGLLNYAVYKPITLAFAPGGDMPGLVNSLQTVIEKCENYTHLATFAENHDVPRFASIQNDTALAQNALAFTLLTDGIPLVYQSQETHPNTPNSPHWLQPPNPTLATLTKTLNHLRHHALLQDPGYPTNHSETLYLDGSTYITRKGTEGMQIVSAFSNRGDTTATATTTNNNNSSGESISSSSSSSSNYQVNVTRMYHPGTEVMEMLGCERHVSATGGVISVDFVAGAPKVFYPVKYLNGSGLCGF